MRPEFQRLVSRATLAAAIAWLPGNASNPAPAPEPVPAPEPAAADTAAAVPLYFDWQPGMEATVEHRNRRVRHETDGSVKDIAMTGRQHLTVAAHGEGLAVAWSPLEDMQLTGVPEGDQVVLAGVAALAAVPMTYVVSPDGELVDVEGLEELGVIVQRLLQDILQPLEDSIGESPELEKVRSALVGAMEAAASPEALRASAADRWMELVWLWAWEELPVGEGWEAEGEEPSPLMPQVMIPMQYRMTLLEFVPCEEGGGASAECVKLELLAAPEPVGYREHWERAMAAMGMPEGTVELKDFDVSNRLTVITHPETLVPSLFRRIGTANATLSEGGIVSEVRRVDETEMVFRWKGR